MSDAQLGAHFEDTPVPVCWPAARFTRLQMYNFWGSYSWWVVTPGFLPQFLVGQLPIANSALFVPIAGHVAQMNWSQLEYSVRNDAWAVWIGHTKV